MAQASVLTDTEIRRVFRIIETTKHSARNRLAFVLSIYAGLRVGEIAALTVGDVINGGGEVRREIKLGAHQTKGSKGRTVILSSRVRGQIGAYVKTRVVWRDDAALIASQRNGAAILGRQFVDAIQGNIRDGRATNVLTFRTADFCHSVECQGRWNADHSEAYGASQYRYNGAVLRRER